MVIPVMIDELLRVSTICQNRIINSIDDQVKHLVSLVNDKPLAPLKKSMERGIFLEVLKLCWTPTGPYGTGDPALSPYVNSIAEGSDMVAQNRSLNYFFSFKYGSYFQPVSASPNSTPLNQVIRPQTTATGTESNDGRLSPSVLARFRPSTQAEAGVIIRITENTIRRLREAVFASKGEIQSAVTSRSVTDPVFQSQWDEFLEIYIMLIPVVPSTATNPQARPSTESNIRQTAPRPNNPGPNNGRLGIPRFPRLSQQQWEEIRRLETANRDQSFRVQTEQMALFLRTIPGLEVTVRMGDDNGGRSSISIWEVSMNSRIRDRYWARRRNGPNQNHTCSFR